MDSNTLIVSEGDMMSLSVVCGGKDTGELCRSLPRNIIIEENAALNLVIALMPAEDCTRKLCECTITLAGKGARCNASGFIIGSGEDHKGITLTMKHDVGECESFQHFRILAYGKSRCSFYGKIIVAPDAQKTQAYQQNHNMLMSDSATITTLPQLEIYADDVKCSHGATTGKISEEEMFYMRSRGIPASQARELLLKAFMAPVIENIADSTEKQAVADNVERLLITLNE